MLRWRHGSEPPALAVIVSIITYISIPIVGLSSFAPPKSIKIPKGKIIMKRKPEGETK